MNFSAAKKGIFALVAAIFLFSAAVTVEKKLLQIFSLPTFSFLVFFGGTIPAFFILKFAQKPVFSQFKKNQKLFFSVAILNFFRVVFWFFAMKNFFLGEFGFLSQSVVIFTIFLSAIFLHEKFSRAEIPFLFFAIFGIFLVSFRGGNFYFWPTAAIFSSQFLLAVQNILMKKNPQIDVFIFTFWRAAGTFLLLNFYLFFLQKNFFTEISVNFWPTVAAIFDGFFAIFVMRALLFSAMRFFGAGRTAIFFGFSAFLVLIFGRIFFAEKLFWWQIFGGAILIFSIFFLHRAKK